MSDSNKLPIPIVNIYKMGGESPLDHFCCCPLHITLAFLILWVVEFIVYLSSMGYGLRLGFIYWPAYLCLLASLALFFTEVFFWLALILEKPLWPMLYFFRNVGGTLFLIAIGVFYIATLDAIFGVPIAIWYWFDAVFFAIYAYLSFRFWAYYKSVAA